MKACKPPIDFAMEQLESSKFSRLMLPSGLRQLVPLLDQTAQRLLEQCKQQSISADNSYVAATAAASSAAAASSGSGPGAGGVTPGPAAAGTLQQYVSAMKDLGHAINGYAEHAQHSLQHRSSSSSSVSQGQRHMALVRQALRQHAPQRTAAADVFCHDS
jgi:hypothetical protein